MIRIDAHYHVWDPARGDYGWLTPDLAPLYRVFAMPELAPQMDAAGMAGAVLVQAAPTEAETDYLLDIARATPSVLGVVGWVDLDAADVVDRIAARAADPLLVGIRPMLQDLADRDWILDPRHAPALAALADHGLVFDALIGTDQIDAIVTLADRHPKLSIVVDHAAKPRIGNPEGWPMWLDGIVRLAAHDNVTCKLSGLLTEAPPGADAATLRPYVDALHAAFGADRLIWGSDWPVLTLASSYADWFAMAAALVPKADQDAIFGSNAVRCYRLDTATPA